MGGLAVSFFVYLMFLAPHPGEPIPSFQHIVPLHADGSLTVQLLTTLTLLAIGYFAVRHFVLLVRNLRAWRTFSRSAAYASFRQSNAEVQVMAIPLTLAMSVNVVLILAALAVPGLWGVKEFLFPFALLAVSAIAIYALWLFGRYVARIIGHGGSMPKTPTTSVFQLNRKLMGRARNPPTQTEAAQAV